MYASTVLLCPGSTLLKSAPPCARILPSLSSTWISKLRYSSFWSVVFVMVRVYTHTTSVPVHTCIPRFRRAASLPYNKSCEKPFRDPPESPCPWPHISPPRAAFAPAYGKDSPIFGFPRRIFSFAAYQNPPIDGTISLTCDIGSSSPAPTHEGPVPPALQYQSAVK